VCGFKRGDCVCALSKSAGKPNEKNFQVQLKKGGTTLSVCVALLLVTISVFVQSVSQLFLSFLALSLARQ